MTIWHWSAELHTLTKCPRLDVGHVSTDCCHHKVTCTWCMRTKAFKERIKKYKHASYGAHSHATKLKCNRPNCSECNRQTRRRQALPPPPPPYEPPRFRDPDHQVPGSKPLRVWGTAAMVRRKK